MKHLHKSQDRRVLIPQKSLIEASYVLHKTYDNPIPKTKLTPITISDIKESIDQDSIYDWINRLISSNLLLKGYEKGNYLCYPPYVFFKSYDPNQKLFAIELIKNLINDPVIITDNDISPHTIDGFSTQELYIILDDLKIYNNVHNGLTKNNAFFLFIPDAKNKPERSLIAYTLFIRADTRALIAMHEIYEKMSLKEREVFIELVCKSNAPILLTDFVLSALDHPQDKIHPIFKHHKFTKDYEIATVNGGYSTSLLY